MAIDQKQRRGSHLKADLLRLRLLRVARFLDEIAADVAAGHLPDSRDAFILEQLDRGETLTSIGEVLGLTKQRVFQLASRARAAEANGSDPR